MAWVNNRTYDNIRRSSQETSAYNENNNNNKNVWPHVRVKFIQMLVVYVYWGRIEKNEYKQKTQQHICDHNS